MAVERAAGGTSLIDVLDRVLDKGIVIDAWVRVSLVGIDLITVEARVVVASIDTYLKYSEAVGQSVPVARPALESRPYDELVAENQALRAELNGPRSAERVPRAASPSPAAARLSVIDGSRVRGEWQRDLRRRPTQSWRCSKSCSAVRTAAAARKRPPTGWLPIRCRAETVFAAPDNVRGHARLHRRRGHRSAAVQALLPVARRSHPSARQRAHQRQRRVVPRARATRVTPVRQRAVHRGQGRRASDEDPALGLLLIRPALEPPHTTVRWVADSLAPVCRLQHARGPLEEDPRLRREHALLFSIINAATDPIMFTNMDGQLDHREHPRGAAVHRA